MVQATKEDIEFCLLRMIDYIKRMTDEEFYDFNVGYPANSIYSQPNWYLSNSKDPKEYINLIRLELRRI